ncbi:MAG TPA: hypothetical protein VMW65_06150 [Chloroflexota bacterium]|nr:hypothetical protein [Chloroflexota bacterium]
MSQSPRLAAFSLYGTMVSMVNRLRKDPFFFGMVVCFLWLATFSLSITFYLFRDPISLLGAIISYLLASWLFRWRRT